jgi:hypothetical protein
MEKNSDHISFWVTLLVFSFLIPSQFSIEILGLRLSAYRVVLLLSFLPVAKIYLPRIKKLPVDLFVFVAVGFMFASMLVNNGSAGIAYGGSIILETIVPYLLGRVYIQNKENLMAFADVHFKVILLLLIPVVYELLTGFNLFVNTFGGVVLRNYESIRYGFYRAEGPFDHAILFGIFAASGLALTSISKKNGITKYLVIFVVTCTSISSGAFLMLAMQTAMLKIRRLAHARLSSYALVLIGVYTFINIFSNRSPIAVLSSFALDPNTAYYRILTHTYAMDNVMQNPYFGIGLNDWSRPEWLSPSLDDFWLVIAVQHGLIALTCITIVIYLSLKSTYVNYTTSESIGIRVLLFSIIVAGFSVDLWNALYVLFWLIIGLSNNLGQFKPSDQNLY